MKTMRNLYPETWVINHFRKKLLELVEFIKKQANSAKPHPSPGSALPVIALQYNINENSKEAKDLDNKKKTNIPMNLSKIKVLGHNIYLLI